MWPGCAKPPVLPAACTGNAGRRGIHIRQAHGVPGKAEPLKVIEVH